MGYTQPMVKLQTMLEDYKKSNLQYNIPVMVGLNTFGNYEYADLTEIKSILMGGATGSGKSVFGDALISSLILRFSPKELKLLLIDPKRVELLIFNGIPHMITDTIVDADQAIKWLYKVYDNKKKNNDGSYTLIVIDTSSDLMVFNPIEATKIISEIARYGSEYGVYLIVCDSRVCIEVFPNVFLKNFKTHICFNVSSKLDSKLLINSDDGSHLLGKGDMLFQSESGEIKRIQGPNITEKEILSVVSSLKK